MARSINSGPAGRARQLAIAMERLRWVVRDPPKTRIDVNTAATILDYWRDGRISITATSSRASRTSKLRKSRRASRSWLPTPNGGFRSIAAKEMATKGWGWLAANHFSMENGRYVQQSGPKNSLGVVKLDVEDPQQIYLHDTPAKALFALPERHRSHGCVRVQNALQFASMLAEQDGVLDQFQKAMATGNETYVKLKTNIPVRLSIAPHISTVANPVPAGRLRLGRQCRDGAWTGARRTAQVYRARAREDIGP